MSEHDWHTLPGADCSGIICWKCDTVFEPDYGLYFRPGEYHKPGLKDDPGCAAPDLTA